MSRLIPIFLAFSLLVAGAARASDLDDAAPRGDDVEASQHAMHDGDGGRTGGADRCDHCCHGCSYPVGASGTGTVLPIDGTRLGFGFTDTAFDSLSFPPLLEPPSI